nr:MAG TPA: laminarinase-like protein [Herelleviridae sp.]
MKIPHQFTTLSAKLSAVAAMSVMVVSMGATAATAATATSASADSVGGTVGTVSTDSLPTPVASGYQLTFHDEFDGSQLDTSKWGYQYGCFDPGQRSQATYTDSPDNVSVHDGYLNLTARYSPTKTKWDGSQIPRTCKNGSTVYDAPFTSGMITTKKSDGAVLYAAPASGFYVEARIKLPTARSSWSSFWTTGSKKKLGGWPGIGEADIFESKGYDPEYLMSNTHTPQAGNPKKSEQHQGMMHGDTATSQSEFHTYGMLKTADAIEFYFDGQMTHRVKMSDIKGPNPFVDPDNNYILKLNQMVGGNYLTNAKDWSDKTYVDATKFADDYKGGADGTDFAGSTMYVDYVRVYEPKTESDQPAQPVDPTPVPSPEQPSQPAEPTPAPEQPAPSPAPAPAPEQPEPQPVPAKPTPAQPAPAVPTKPGPAKPQPAQPQPSPAPAVPSQPADQAQPSQPAQSEQTQPAPEQQPTQPKKQQKPHPDRLANTGMTSWYRPIVVAWNNFCSWITSWWFW